MMSQDQNKHFLLYLDPAGGASRAGRAWTLLGVQLRYPRFYTGLHPCSPKCSRDSYTLAKGHGPLHHFINVSYCFLMACTV